jgi:small-conductance mechanosensitive channel
VQQAINFEIHRAFEAAGIEFAFPTQTIHMAGT